jgi:predicted dehydrogenase
MSSAVAAGALKASQLKSPNDTIRAACVGIRGQGASHVRELSSQPNTEVAAICDVDQSILAARLKDLESRNVKKPATYTDIRKLLEDKTIDAISIATPNHWHSLIAIWAMQAGKDVYVEKPCSHNIFESRQIVAAARKYNRIVQHGSQTRSSPSIQQAFQAMKEGLLGEVYLSRGLCYKTRNTIGKTPVEPVPAGVDYDLWTGPAPKREFSKNRFHYNWHWFWDTGNGDFGNQGIHEVDISRWGLGVTYPTKISASGGKVVFDDDQETPNVLMVNYEFNVNGKKKLMVFEVRHWYTNSEANTKVGNVFYGEKGYMGVDGYTNAYTFMGQKGEPGPQWKGGASHFANFLQAVRSRKASELNAPIEEGAISCTLMHLGNIAYRLGRVLTFDEKSMTVVGDKEANAMFTRNYRTPFVVPEKV